MSQEILINFSPQESRVAIVEGGVLQELHLERSLERGLVGNIYLGKVTRVLPGMQSAFIDIGLEHAGLLHAADLPSGFLRSDAAAEERPNPLPIEKQIFEGQSLMVQVLKDPIGSKGARLSMQISIAGRHLVYLPQDTHIGVSQKIPLEMREALRQKLIDLARENLPAGELSGGFILRTNAEDSGDDELREDIAYLRKTWSRIRERSRQLPPPSKLHTDLDLLQRVLRDFVSNTTTSIRIDSKVQLQRLQEFGADFMPRALAKLQLYTGDRPIFDLFNIDEELQRALGRRVDLKSGGYLIIDQTEAMTTVDVNTGGFVGARNFDETIFKTNLEAAHAIARQLRLRNLGGIIIADFIDMTTEDHQAAVLNELRSQMARDRVKTSISDFSQLGLVEMTRKRTRESLERLLCEPCIACDGRGTVKTPRTVSYEIFRELLREARQFNPREFGVLVHPHVLELLREEESEHLAELSSFIGKPITLRAEPEFKPDQFDIVLS